MRKTATTKLAIIGSVALLFAGIAWAQDAEYRKHVLHELGGPFFVSRDNVQEDLKLSDDQKKKLDEKLSDDVQETKRVFEKFKDLKGKERERALLPHRRKSYEGLEAFLKQNLTADQLKRFGQLKLQYDTPAVMIQPEVVKELNITDEQRKQFMDAIQDMQREIQPLMKQAQSGGNAEEIKLKVIKMRQDCQAKIETLLSDVQKKQWKEMTGPPLVIW